MRHIVALLLAIACTHARAATTVSQHGITWTFSADHTVGQYANGDYYVVAPSGLTITAISPASTDTAGRVINGSMVNPSGANASPTQGFDSAMYDGYESPAYSSALNAARPGGNDLSVGNPLVLPAGSSLISSISHATAGNRPQLTDAAVLTVVSAAPASGSFRPPYTGTDKTHSWNKSQLNYSILRSLTPTANWPALATVEGYFARPWIEINTSWIGRYMHPVNNQPDYGREIAWNLGTGLLALHLNYSNAQKEALYVRLVQYGLDVYGAARTGGIWEDLGGHNQGRKMPLLLAGLALNDSAVLAYANPASHNIFQDDRQTWYVVQYDVGRVLYTADGRPREQYIQADVGLPEWGEQHTRAEQRDGRNWDASYRDICGQTFAAHALAAQLTTGARTTWNHQAFFDYADRYLAWAPDARPTLLTEHLEMWDAYRSLGAAIWTSGGGSASMTVNTLTVGSIQTL